MEEKKINISISVEKYQDKNTILWNSQTYRKQTIDIPTFAELIKQGYNYTALFTDNDTFTTTEKREDNFKGTQIVTFDLDNIKCNYTLTEFLCTLKHTPSIAYTTRNNGLIKKGDTKPYSRFRLLYIFDELITDVEVYQSIYDEIRTTFNEEFFDATKKEDKCGKSPFQQYSGNGQKDCQIYKTQRTYIIDVFPTAKEIQDGLFALTQIYGEDKPMKAKAIPKRFKDKAIYDDVPSATKEDNIIKDLFRMPYGSILRKYKDRYQLIQETPLDYGNSDTWHNQGYILKPNGYISINRPFGTYKDKNDTTQTHCLTIRDGQRRRNKLYTYSKLRRQIKPSITKEELIYNLLYDVRYYMDNTDNQLTPNVLSQIAESAIKSNYEIEQKDGKYKVNKEWCKDHGTTPRKHSCKIRKILNSQRIGEVYDVSKSLIENLKDMKKDGSKIGKDTLYKWCKDNGIDTKPRDKWQEVRQHYDTSISVYHNFKNMKEKGIKIGRQTLINYCNKNNINQKGETMKKKPYTTPTMEVQEITPTHKMVIKRSSKYFQVQKARHDKRLNSLSINHQYKSALSGAISKTA